jgi:hypothetical protein
MASMGGSPGPSSYVQHSPARQAIETALDQPAGEVEFTQTPLTEACLYLSNHLSVSFRLDTARLEAAGIFSDAPVDFQAPPLATMRETLGLLVESVDAETLDYVVDNGVLTLTTREHADEQLETVIYEVRDLGAGLSSEFVTEAIREGTSGPWQDSDGMGGSVVSMPGGVLVRQSQRGHREVVALLDQLRRFAARSDLPAAPSMSGMMLPMFGGGYGPTVVPPSGVTGSYNPLSPGGDAAYTPPGAIPESSGLQPGVAPAPVPTGAGGFGGG